MDDHEIHQHIDELVAEEHHLERAHAGAGLSDAERARLDDLGVQLDRYWDLLRQRDARRRAGQDPEAAQLRDAGTVEGLPPIELLQWTRRGPDRPSGPFAQRAGACRAERRSRPTGTMGQVIVRAVSRAALAGEIAELAADRAGRVRVAVDGAAPTRPGELAAAAAGLLRERGRDAVVVDAADFLRPASVRLEFGHEDPDELLERWLDEGALRREVLGTVGPVLPRLWNAAADRAYRDPPVDLAGNGVVLLHGALLLGRGLPLDATAHLRMASAALARHLPAWQLPAFARYSAEHDPEGEADLVVLADHPDRPAIRRETTQRG